MAHDHDTPDTAALVAETREQIAALHEWRDDEPGLTRAQERAIAEAGGGFWLKRPCPKHAARFELECPACNAKNAEFVFYPPDAEPPLERLRRLTGDCDTLDLWRDAGFAVPTGGES